MSTSRLLVVCVCASVALNGSRAARAGSASVALNALAPGDVPMWDISLSAGDVLAAMTTPLGSNPSLDTMMGLFDPNDNLFAFNDDAGTGFGFASGIRALPLATGAYSLRVTGIGDDGFAGAHTESGGFALTYAVVPDAGGDFADSAGNATAATADTLSVGAGTAAVARNAFDALGGDVDFYAVFLRAGDILSAMTAPLDDPNFLVPDTLLGVFDTDGTTLLRSNDDGGTHDPFEDFSDYGSVVRFQAPADGTYFLAVTGFGDNTFTGNHSEVGEYGLLVSVVPEPGAALLLVSALLAASSRRNVRRPPHDRRIRTT